MAFLLGIGTSPSTGRAPALALFTFAPAENKCYNFSRPWRELLQLTKEYRKTQVPFAQISLARDYELVSISLSNPP